MHPRGALGRSSLPVRRQIATGNSGDQPFGGLLGEKGLPVVRFCNQQDLENGYKTNLLLLEGYFGHLKMLSVEESRKASLKTC